jgi:hypothetical protein
MTAHPQGRTRVNAADPVVSCRPLRADPRSDLKVCSTHPGDLRHAIESLIAVNGRDVVSFHLPSTIARYRRAIKAGPGRDWAATIDDAWNTLHSRSLKDLVTGWPTVT